MSKYTTELRHICNVYGEENVLNWFKDYELTDYLTDEEIEVITTRGTWSKEKLAKKILNHYYMREIGFETPSLFKLKVKVLLQEIMEEKLPLIYSSSIKYDPLINVDYKEILERSIESSGDSSSESTNTGSGLSVNSDTPQGQISKSDILNGAYASSTTASETESSINDSSESNSNTEENYTKHIIGNSGVSATAQKMVEQYRQNIITIDKDIIEELNILFMGLF